MNESLIDPKKCKYCNKEFKPRRPKQLFCKSKCRVDYWMKLHPRVNSEK